VLGAGVACAGELEGERAVGRLLPHSRRRAGHEAVGVEVLERVEVDLHFLGDALEPDLVSRRDAGERELLGGVGDGAGDGVAVRTRGRVAEELVEPRLHVV
jgi:hypothetical protein